MTALTGTGEVSGDGLAPLVGGVQRYAWGSPSFIPELRGEVPGTDPLAEVWFGAHPAMASGLNSPSGESLLQRIAQNPQTALGAASVARHGERLPYLLKLLAAAEPLSIQVHPSIAQAVAGCAAEDAAGIERSAPNRSFRDANHKPELIAAITQFEAMVGFRPVAATVDFLKSLAVSELSPLVEELESAGTGAALKSILLMDTKVATNIVDNTAVAAAGVSGSWAPEADLLVRLNNKYPGDRGVLTAALLNRIVLQPGEAVYLGAGSLHAYVNGLGVEIMANSDNVLRGGLTPKHMDVPALLDVVIADPITPDVQVADGAVTTYQTPAPEFELTRYDQPVDAIRRLQGAEIVLCVGGTLSVTARGQSVSVSSGDAVWCPVESETTTISGTGLVFVAGVGHDL